MFEAVVSDYEPWVKGQPQGLPLRRDLKAVDKAKIFTVVGSKEWSLLFDGSGGDEAVGQLQ